MKNMFNAVVIVTSVVISLLFWYYYMGHPDYVVKNEGELPHPLTNAADWVKHMNETYPDANYTTENYSGFRATLGVIHTGGFIVGILLSFIIIGITFTIERYLSIRKARGNGNPEVFIKAVVEDLSQGNLDSALAKCDEQRGSIANILRSAIDRFKEIENDPEYPAEKKLSEVQRSIDESMNLETPLLEKNLVILSTIASISVLFGLLGTTLGMIRAFQALGESSGGVDAQALSIGISEALYNTAGGLIGALIAIMMYNFFTTKVDSFVYMIDEAILSVTQIFTGRIKKS